MARAMSRFVSPCHTKSATCISFAVSRSRGCMICLLLHKHCGRKLHTLAPISNSRAQKECAQVLFHRSRANVQLGSDFFIAASLDQQLQYLFVTVCNFYCCQIWFFLADLHLLFCPGKRLLDQQLLRHSFASSHEGTNTRCLLRLQFPNASSDPRAVPCPTLALRS